MILGSIAQANECNRLHDLAYSNYLSVNDVQEMLDLDITYSDDATPLFSSSLMTDERVVKFIGDFDPKRCEYALSQMTVKLDEKSSLNMVYTTEDRCDGGNSYGYLTNQDQELIGFITDSEISCL